MSILKLVLILRTIFTRENDPVILLAYLKNCLTKGSTSTLYCNPHIATAEYTAGQVAYDALNLALSNHNATPTEDTLNIVKDKMALAVLWLHGYADKVVVIANDDANRTTRDEAKTNIGLSGLDAQKLSSSAKGIPDVAAFTAKIADGIITTEITNEDFIVGNVVMIAVEAPPVTDPVTPPAVVKLVDGQVNISSKVALRTVSKTYSGKGKIMKLNGMNTKLAYFVYLYSMNGNKQISLLSDPVLVTNVLPE